MIRETVHGKTVLVTGGAGFIGSHLCDAILKECAKELIIVDNLFLGSKENIEQAVAKGATFYNEDIEFETSMAYIFERHNVDIVFNCATKALNYSFVNPANAFDTNVKGILNLLELQRKGKFKSLCHFSTSEVYGTAIYEPMDEKHPKAPTTTYAAGKAAADLALESYVNMFELDAFIVRPFNNYGPRQNFKGFMAGIIPITAQRILTGKAPPEIHGGGSQSRDFIYITDTVNAVMQLFPIMPTGESINISTDNCFTMSEVVHKICAYYKYAGEIIEKPARGADVLCHLASNEKVKTMISYELTSFEEGLANTLTWYKENIPH
ncbi:NAD-dependent epimerase/dehydratase family protein [Paremcibacter congregatus]|uniref:UDP-glucose 4-epimerase n=1 Tax=Paremcibacter congregatus TaxID=2043170 RepID=A0A2G4YR94_9PROT|nr:NAD-dependent epimerase/dehydratase family protein [Paremcibacter congregatus]PHZ84849.1 UDP-glucose 4-epimerase [Paremcibacter congregatus]QDE26178.1 NAD-dependent epimerase/dehydratase family protein [Paremcibacter congregatus]